MYAMCLNERDFSKILPVIPQHLRYVSGGVSVCPRASDVFAASPVPRAGRLGRPENEVRRQRGPTVPPALSPAPGCCPHLNASFSIVSAARFSVKGKCSQFDC